MIASKVISSNGYNFFVIRADVIGHVTACQELDNFDKNGNKGKKKPLTLIDGE